MGKNVHGSSSSCDSHTSTFSCEWQSSVACGGRSVLCIFPVFTQDVKVQDLCVYLCVCNAYIGSLCTHDTSVNMQRPEEDVECSLLELSALFS